ncbi:MAG: SEC-C domain-containing protein, partial [Proteiniclasticum sp.]|nr:SEC-C domain-containing protein [Proteiniclasticum sp.]
KAEYLYNIPAWDHILTEEKREELAKQLKDSRTVRNENKVGRNDPCPCGSGKKYKKCHGK